MTASPTNVLTIVTPVYDDEEAASCLFRELAAVVGPEVYVVAVDDGSVRLPLPASSISRAGLDGVVITLKRNVGHQRAIAVGLNYVAECLNSTTKVVVMDSDGEDRPQAIGSLLEPLKISDVDVVVAERRNRVETLRFRAFYVIYKRIFQALTGRKISFGNFIACFRPRGGKRAPAASCSHRFARSGAAWCLQIDAVYLASNGQAGPATSGALSMASRNYSSSATSTWCAISPRCGPSCTVLC
jgi:glycosyltransferase involved in cell wall biosynthesis